MTLRKEKIEPKMIVKRKTTDEYFKILAVCKNGMLLIRSEINGRLLSVTPYQYFDYRLIREKKEA